MRGEAENGHGDQARTSQARANQADREVVTKTKTYRP
jgi:hypothetical protein